MIFPNQTDIGLKFSGHFPNQSEFGLESASCKINFFLSKPNWNWFGKLYAIFGCNFSKPNWIWFGKEHWIKCSSTETLKEYQAAKKGYPAAKKTYQAAKKGNQVAKTGYQAAKEKILCKNRTSSSKKTYQATKRISSCKKK